MGHNAQKVSVVITCYNQGEYLKECIESVKNSTCQNIEIIVVDDGSDDIITSKALDNLDDNSLTIIRQTNQGVCTARNNGIAAASGEYILPLDADDKIGREYLKDAVEILNSNPQVGMVYCNAILWNTKNGKERLWELPPATLLNMLVQNRIFSSAVFRKSDFENLGGYNTIMEEGGEDWELWINFLEHNFKPYKINKTLFYYRIADNYRTKNAVKPQNFLRIRQNIIKLHKNLYRKYAPVIAFPMLFMFIKNILSFVIKNRWKIKEILLQYLSTAKLRLIKPQFGLNKTEEREKQLIVTLTSFPERINEVHLCINTLLNQTLKPDKIILWLAEEEFPNKEQDLPKNLLKLKNYGLSIEWCENLKSYKKFVPALLKYPDAILITADDDVFYQKNWLELLYKSYRKSPENVHGHRIHRITVDENGKLLPYIKWKKNITSQSENETYLATGVGGILIPPHALYKDACNKELFQKLAPNGDDIWIWAMTELNNAKTVLAPNNLRSLYYINPLREYKIINQKTLSSTNLSRGNDIQLQAVLEYYPQLNSKISGAQNK